MRGVCPTWKTRRKPRLMRGYYSPESSYIGWFEGKGLHYLRSQKCLKVLTEQGKRLMDRIIWDALAGGSDAQTGKGVDREVEERSV